MKAYLVFLLACLVAFTAAQDPIQGLDEGIGRGFDLKYGKIGAPVISLTYDEGHIWTNPLTKKQWQVPDQLIVTNNPASYEVDELIAIKTHEDYIHTMEKWHSTSVFLFFFGYNDMKSTGTIDELLSNGTNQVYLWNRDFSTYSLTMWPQTAIPEASHPKFTASIDRLPETCTDETSMEAYDRFLGLFGTHYIAKARYGGQVTHTISIADTVTQKHSSSWVHKQTSMWIAYYNFKLGLGGGSEVTEGDIDSEYLKYMNASLDYYGGESTMEEDGFSQWAETVDYNPAMLYPEYRAITELMPVGPKQSCAWKALSTYLNTDDGPLPEGEPLMSALPVTEALPVAIDNTPTLKFTSAPKLPETKSSMKLTSVPLPAKSSRKARPKTIGGIKKLDRA